MDTFTATHLAAYVAESVYEDDRDYFSAWVLLELAADPSLADLGWPSLYATWRGLVHE